MPENKLFILITILCISTIQISAAAAQAPGTIFKASQQEAYDRQFPALPIDDNKQLEYLAQFIFGNNQAKRLNNLSRANLQTLFTQVSVKHAKLEARGADKPLYIKPELGKIVATFLETVTIQKHQRDEALDSESEDPYELL